MNTFEAVRRRADADGITRSDVAYLESLLADPATKEVSIFTVVSFVIRVGQSDRKEQRELAQSLRPNLERLLTHEADPRLAAHVLFNLEHGWGSAPRYYEVVIAALRGLPWDSEYREMLETAVTIAIGYVEKAPTRELISTLLDLARNPPSTGTGRAGSLAVRSLHPLWRGWRDLTPQQRVQYANTQSVPDEELIAAAEEFLNRAQ